VDGDESLENCPSQRPPNHSGKDRTVGIIRTVGGEKSALFAAELSLAASMIEAEGRNALRRPSGSCAPATWSDCYGIVAQGRAIFAAGDRVELVAERVPLQDRRFRWLGRPPSQMHWHSRAGRRGGFPRLHPLSLVVAGRHGKYRRRELVTEAACSVERTREKVLGSRRQASITSPPSAIQASLSTQPRTNRTCLKQGTAKRRPRPKPLPGDTTESWSPNKLVAMGRIAGDQARVNN